MSETNKNQKINIFEVFIKIQSYIEDMNEAYENKNIYQYDFNHTINKINKIINIIREWKNKDDMYDIFTNKEKQIYIKIVKMIKEFRNTTKLYKTKKEEYNDFYIFEIDPPNKDNNKKYTIALMYRGDKINQALNMILTTHKIINFKQVSKREFGEHLFNTREIGKNKNDYYDICNCVEGDFYGLEFWDRHIIYAIENRKKNDCILAKNSLYAKLYRVKTI